MGSRSLLPLELDGVDVDPSFNMAELSAPLSLQTRMPPCSLNIEYLFVCVTVLAIMFIAVSPMHILIGNVGGCGV